MNSSSSLYTGSQITIYSIKNITNRNSLIEAIRKITNTQLGYRIHLIKAHIGTYGNELADKLAKEGASSRQKVCYSNIPKCTILHNIQEDGINEWQKNREESTKGATAKLYSD